MLAPLRTPPLVPKLGCVVLHPKGVRLPLSVNPHIQVVLSRTDGRVHDLELYVHTAILEYCRKAATGIVSTYTCALKPAVLDGFISPIQGTAI